MSIRLATKKDAQTIHDLHTESVTGLCNLYSNEIIEGWLKGRTPDGYKGIDKNEMYVYEIAGRIVGFSHVVPGEIIAIFVSPDHAREGVGTKLLKHAIPLAKRGWDGPVKIKATLNAVP
ncbi:MAG: GNAT family N-acetyltransferase, partial [Acidobacteriota bacterium]|nr:GNAT family N-acetyltransferase [Acidobacteriota bacterium]